MAQIGETELDMRALSAALWRRAWLLVLVAVAVGAAVYVGLGFVDPLYTADTKILIEERESPLTRPRDQTAASSAAEFDESAIQSQVEVLRSREIADAVIDKLDLTRRPEFDPARNPSPIDALLVTLGLRDHPAAESIRQRVMDTYFEHLSVFPLAKSRVIGLEFVASDPVLAAEVANAIAEAFVDLQQDAKRQSAVAATAWLEQEIDRLRSRVAEAEQAVAEYRSSNDLFGTDQSQGLSTQQLGDLNAELARAKAARSEAEARAELIDSLLSEGGSLEASQEVLDSQLIQRLRERQVALRAQIAELSTTLLPAHPRIRALQGQLANLDGQIRQEAQKVKAALNTAARVAAARERSLTESLNAAKTDVTRSNSQEIELRALEREATAQRDLLESFLARYREAVARTDADYLPADARIISRAIAPREPSFPKKTMMAAAASIAAFLLVAAILLLREFTSGRAFRVVDYGLTFAPGRPVEPLEARRVPVPVAAREPAVTREPEPIHVSEARSITEPAETVDTLGTTEPVAEVVETPIAAESIEPEETRSGTETAETFDPLDDAEPEPESARESDTPPISDAAAQLFREIEGPDEEIDDAEPMAAPSSLGIEGERPGTAELAEIIANPAVRTALFAGAAGGEGAGEIAFAAARRAAQENLRLVLIDVGLTPSEALGGRERPGLGDLLAGEAAFGEVIRRDEASRVHLIPMGSAEGNPPLQRLQLVVGALTHTYDKVIVVADSLDDWPHEHVRPDIAAIVCGPDTTELFRSEVYEAALERGARSALIVRFASEKDDTDGREESAAA